MKKLTVTVLSLLCCASLYAQNNDEGFVTIPELPDAVIGTYQAISAVGEDLSKWVSPNDVLITITKSKISIPVLSISRKINTCYRNDNPGNGIVWYYAFTFDVGKPAAGTIIIFYSYEPKVKKYFYFISIVENSKQKRTATFACKKL